MCVALFLVGALGRKGAHKEVYTRGGAYAACYRAMAQDEDKTGRPLSLQPMAGGNSPPGTPPRGPTVALAGQMDHGGAHDPLSGATTQLALYRQFARELANSGFCPWGNPSDVLFILLTGAEVGMGPMQSLRSIYAGDQGKPCLSADAMAAIVKRSAFCEYFYPLEMGPVQCTYITKRTDEPRPVEFTFTIDDAARAGLVSGEFWQRFPKAMLKARSITHLARTVYPDLVGGFYDPAELMAPTGPIGQPAPAKVHERLQSQADQLDHVTPKEGSLDEDIMDWFYHLDGQASPPDTSARAQREEKEEQIARLLDLIYSAQGLTEGQRDAYVDDLCQRCGTTTLSELGTLYIQELAEKLAQHSGHDTLEHRLSPRADWMLKKLGTYQGRLWAQTHECIEALLLEVCDDRQQIQEFWEHILDADRWTCWQHVPLRRLDGYRRRLASFAPDRRLEAIKQLLRPPRASQGEDGRASQPGAHKKTAYRG